LSISLILFAVFSCLIYALQKFETIFLKFLLAIDKNKEYTAVYGLILSLLFIILGGFLNVLLSKVRRSGTGRPGLQMRRGSASAATAAVWAAAV